MTCSRVGPNWVGPFFFLLLSPVFFTSSVRGGETVSLLLRQGDPEALLHDVMTYTGADAGGPSPILITLEPGPLELAGGLRLLAAEIPPHLTLPDRLIISADEDTALSDAFLAFMRRCLINHIPIWLVGDQFPQAVAAFPMEPGWVIERIETQALGHRLRALCHTRAPAQPAPE